MHLPRCYFLAIFCIIYLLFHPPHGTAIQGENVRDARENEFPFTVALSHIGNKVHRAYLQFCTGSLITRKHVLTAEHCVIEEEVKNVVILVGSADLKKCKTYKSESWITYQEWKYNDSKKFLPYVHDVAVITLEISVREVQPAVVPIFKPEYVYGSDVKLAGWGLTNGHVAPSVLRMVHLKVLTNTRCDSELSRLLKKNVTLPDWDLCTMSDPWSLTACGDSGGPLLDKRNELIAIAIGSCPDSAIIFKKFPQQFLCLRQLLNQRVNLHASLHHYMDFVRHFTGQSSSTI